jgi:hypothetical protein
VAHRPGPLDALVADIIGRCGYRFAVAADDATRELAYRLRYETVVEQGWAQASEMPDGLERDAYDERALHIVGWDDEVAVATGRLVLPSTQLPAIPLPTEQVCDITIEPRGRVVDVGRMAVARSHQSHRHSVFLALLARLYLEMQAQGHEVACGLMSARARGLARLLGLQLELLGPERQSWGEWRAPVRFGIVGSAAAPAARAPQAP